MIASAPKSSVHSAHVDMHLILGDRRVPLSQLGPDFAIVSNPISEPPGDGEIELVVDGRVTRWRITLAEGLNVNSRRFPFKPRQNGE